MGKLIDRREVLRLAGLGGVVFASGLGMGACATVPGANSGRPASGSAGTGDAAAGGAASAGGSPAADQDFYFVQLSDTHWGYEGAANPDAHGTLPKAIAAVNALSVAPDFVVFTGDLTHLTPNETLRRERLTQFREMAATLRVPSLHFLPGEHDASLDHGKVYREVIGETHYSFDHKGVHFIALDNVSDPRGAIGDEQLAWLATDLARVPREGRIVVLAHRPLFDLVPEWGWATSDGGRAVDLLLPFPNVTVFYGHIHQLHQHMTGHIAHHAAQSLIFPLPPPGSPDHKPMVWDGAHPYRGVGWRQIGAEGGAHEPHSQEFGLGGA
jgi:hypothetical protein